jgi:hypothetical protein
LYSTETGFYVAINNNTQLPLTKYEGVKLATGVGSKIALKTTYVYNLDAPYTDCRMDTSKVLSLDSIYYKQAVSYTTYSRKLCYEMCLQNEFIIPMCNCSDPSVPITDPKQNICQSLNSLRCVESIRNKFDSVPISEHCDRFCPLECTSQKFDTEISMATYPSAYYYSVISQQPSLMSKFANGNMTNTPSSFAASVSYINIYYDVLSYTEFIQVPAMTTDALMGAIGKNFFASNHDYIFIWPF